MAREERFARRVDARDRRVAAQRRPSGGLGVALLLIAAGVFGAASFAPLAPPTRGGAEARLAAPRPALEPAKGRAARPDTTPDLAAAMSLDAPPSETERAARDTARALAPFFRALRALESGARAEPVDILHLGDSHIASDGLTRMLRRKLQARFGDAGRGWMTPPKGFEWFELDRLEIAANGAWRGFNSLKGDAGPFGLSGVRVAARRGGARFEIRSETPIARAVVRHRVGPGLGAFTLSLGDARVDVSATRETDGVETASIEGAGSELSLVATGGAEIFGVALEADRPGVRYSSFGVPGATASLFERWTPALVAAELEAIEPALIVVGYGGNESFDAGLTPEGYRARVEKLLDTLRASAPEAAILVIGPADAAWTGAGGPLCGEGPWRTPPALATTRETLRSVAAARGHGFWDWSSVMGGRCGMLAWAAAAPPLAQADRLHLKRAGYEESAGALFGFLMNAYRVSAPRF